jgi:hypothetical protein
MDNRIGDWGDGNLNGTKAWQKRRVVTGAYREDEEDVVYNFGEIIFFLGDWNKTSSHFWDGYGDWTTFHPPPYTYNYPNSYRKELAYWNGDAEGINSYHDWLYTNFCFQVPGYFYPLFYIIHYNDFSQLYKNTGTQGFISGYRLLGSLQWHHFSPEPINEWMTEYQQSELRDLVCWETIGRMCHLFEDVSVPAHTHYDPHAIDYYEKDYMPPTHHGGQNKYRDYEWDDARDAGGLLDISNIQYKLRFLEYTTCAIARRFPSDDYWGRNEYDSWYFNDNYGQILTPIFNEINNLNPPIQLNPLDENPSVKYYVSSKISQYAYVYCIRAVATYLWYVYNQFNIQSNPPPIVSGFYQDPAYMQNSCNVYCILSQGGNVQYTWIPVNKPANITVTHNNPTNNWVHVFYNNLDEPPPVGEWYLFCRATNQYGQSWMNYYVQMGQGPPITGCPWVLVQDKDEMFQPDNNILQKSEYQGNPFIEIKDVYKLSITPFNNVENKFKIRICELEQDSVVLNQVKMYFVDHYPNERIDITEEGDVIKYDSLFVLSTYEAYQNGNNITDNIQYHNRPKQNPGIDGDSLDHLITNFPPDYMNNFSIITEIGSSRISINNAQKDWVGTMIANTDIGPYQTNFSRRINPSVTVLPIFTSIIKPNYVSNANFDIYKNYFLNYIALADIQYDGFNKVEIPIVNAVNAFYENLLVDIYSLDTNYVFIDSTNFVELTFLNDQPIEPGMDRNYIIEVIGIYHKPSGTGFSNNLLYKKNDNILSCNYSLNQNYPNPFNPMTKIKYSIPTAGNRNAFDVRMIVYDVLGREVADLVNAKLRPGTYEVDFDGSNYASGVYFYRLTAHEVSGSSTGDYVDVKKMILVK